MDGIKLAGYRKRLKKTQKQLAELLSTSLKAVCSYEQGWRPVPPHVERQVYFLIAKKENVDNDLKNCWEILNCPDERRKECPAWEFDFGQYCWLINGLICNSEPRKNWDEKIEICRKCEVMKDII